MPDTERELRAMVREARLETKQLGGRVFGALKEQLRRALAEEEHAKQVFAAPYSSHDSEVAYYEARGVTRGVARSFEALEFLADLSPVVQETEDATPRWFHAVEIMAGRRLKRWEEKMLLAVCDSLHADPNNCPVIVDQQLGAGPGLLLVCNRPQPCPLHGQETEE